MFGIIVDDLLPSQRNLECIDIASIGKAHLFAKCLTKSCRKVDTVLMDISEIWDFNALLIATSLDTYRFMRKAITGGPKALWIYDPNDFKINDHEEIANIDVPIYSRSSLHSTKIFQITGKKAEVIDWNMIFEQWRDK